ELLMQLTALLGRKDITISRDEEFVCDRSLIGTRFTARTGYTLPPWSTMLSELATQIKAREER
ncbi:MAG TPA: hypothetical protein VJS66_04350, partial [Burkholderiales bacterium]|nr:hypothetical protein [Burkholderiales bacterium]